MADATEESVLSEPSSANGKIDTREGTLEPLQPSLSVQKQGNKGEP